MAGRRGGKYNFFRLMYLSLLLSLAFVLDYTPGLAWSDGESF